MNSHRNHEIRLSCVFALVAVIAAAFAGCGQTASGPPAELSITRDFGSKTLLTKSTPVTPGLTAMRQIQGNAKVGTAYSGKFVDTINGLKGSGTAGNDWLFYVDGEQSEKGAASWRVRPKEAIQWDYHQWRDITTPEAIVGAYPRPLSTKGVKPLCRPSNADDCSAAIKGLKYSDRPGAVTLVIGTWDEVAGVKGVPDLTEPAADNGGFARFTGKPGSRKLELLGTDGRVNTTNGAGVGLVLASRTGKAITWIVTGTDDAGVHGAVSMLNESTLKNRFAVAWLGPYGAQALPIWAGEGP
jgi:hypothetical protein